MKNEQFTQNLIKVAFCAMACDLNIDDTEIENIKEITKKDFYFQGYSVVNEINTLKHEFNKKGYMLIENILNEQSELEYSESQKIILIEIALGVIKADRILENSEINFIKQLIINLKIPSDIISLRFGQWDSIDDAKLPIN